jgi:hypothetical protein
VSEASPDARPPSGYDAAMPPRITKTPWITCAGAVLLLACADAKRERTEPPTASTAESSGSGAGSQCPPGGPSVSVNIRGREAGNDMPSEELGALLGWIGGFAKPCMEAEPEAPNFTLAIELAESGQAPTLALGDRDALPGLAACLDASFAKAPPPPPPGSMSVDIVIPWGCPTLGPDFRPEKAKAEPAATP